MTDLSSGKVLNRRFFLKWGIAIAATGLAVGLGLTLPQFGKKTIPPTTTSSTTETTTRTTVAPTTGSTSETTTSTLTNSTSVLPNGWIPNSVVPLAFGPPISCGLPGDEATGEVYMPLYGSGQLKMLFSFPTQQSTIRASVCAWQYGTPTQPLVLTLYSEDMSTVLASAQIQPSGVSPSSSAPNWTSFVTLSPASPLKPGHYNLVASSPNSTSSSGYYAYFNIAGSNWIDPSATASFQNMAANSGGSGFSTIWVKDSNGNDLTLYPFGLVSDVSLVGGSTKFIPASDYQIASLAPWQSDDHFIFGGYTAGYQLEDLTEGKVLGVAPFSQEYNSHGIQGIIPYQLPTPVSLITGHTYQISIQQTGVAAQNDVLGTLIRGSQVNPSKASGVGFPTYWWGEIINSDFSAYRMLDHANEFWSAGDGFGSSSSGPNGQTQDAVRFVPNFTETLSSMSLKMKSSPSNATSVLNSPSTFYPAGHPVTVSLYASDEATPWPSPTGPALASVTVDSGTVPLDGWFTASGFNFLLEAQKAYFVVWSSPSSPEQHIFQRDVSPFRFVVRVSYDGGRSWGNASQGPTDMTWKAICSQETIGNPFDDELNLPVTATGSLVAQPFVLSKITTINSILSIATGGIIKAEIYPDNGSGTGPDILASPLTSGSFNTLYEYFYSGCVIPLVTLTLQANTKYWIVYSSDNTSNVAVAYYWTRPTDPNLQKGYEVRVSNDGGASWSEPTLPSGVGVEPSTSLFLIGALPQ